MSLALSPGSLNPEHPCCTLSWWTVPLALPPHLLIKRFFWNRADSFPLPMNVPLEFRQVTPSHSRSTSWAVNAVAPSFACFRLMGNLVSYLPNTFPIRNTGEKEDVMPFSNLLTLLSSVAQGWIHWFRTSKNTLWKNKIPVCASCRNLPTWCGKGGNNKEISFSMYFFLTFSP